MNTQEEKPGYGNRGKTNCRFSTVPTAHTAADKSAQESSRTKQPTIVYTKCLTLPALAEKDFDVFISVDRNLSFQQNLPKFNIAVLVLQASSNRLADLKPLAPNVLAILPSLTKGKAETVSLKRSG